MLKVDQLISRDLNKWRCHFAEPDLHKKKVAPFTSKKPSFVSRHCLLSRRQSWGTGVNSSVGIGSPGGSPLLTPTRYIEPGHLSNHQMLINTNLYTLQAFGYTLYIFFPFLYHIIATINARWFSFWWEAPAVWFKINRSIDIVLTSYVR